MTPEASKPLVLRDEIHGDIVFTGLVRQVIDHEFFQRLRYIKQLGLGEYVFPCATHTRFQHSLGASHLASRYFRSMVSGWVHAPFKQDVETSGTRLLAAQTFECVTEVYKDKPSLEFWGQVTALAALLHDVGHGPWSHTFEQLELKQDFSEIVKKLPVLVREYFSGLLGRYHHEDISVLYIFQILKDLEAGDYFLPVSLLVNKRMQNGALGTKFESHVEKPLQARGLKGGAPFHRLLRPLISGPFDVDRIDYIQRDGRNCGVSIGGIEWYRILHKVLPCLANYSGRAGEPKNVVLISNFRNQHVLDDFVFSLFQMYAQVYMHPKIVGFEENIRKILQRVAGRKSPLTVTFELHRSLTDDKFRELIRTQLGISDVDSVLLRKPGFEVKVAHYPTDKATQKALEVEGYEVVDLQNRPMMKDSAGVFLFSPAKVSGKSPYVFTPWVSVSPIAKQFYDISYAPQIWAKTSST